MSPPTYGVRVTPRILMSLITAFIKNQIDKLREAQNNDSRFQFSITSGVLFVDIINAAGLFLANIAHSCVVRNIVDLRACCYDLERVVKPLERIANTIVFANLELNS